MCIAAYLLAHLVAQGNGPQLLSKYLLSFSFSKHSARCKRSSVFKGTSNFCGRHTWASAGLAGPLTSKFLSFGAAAAILSQIILCRMGAVPCIVGCLAGSLALLLKSQWRPSFQLRDRPNSPDGTSCLLGGKLSLGRELLSSHPVFLPACWPCDLQQLQAHIYSQRPMQLAATSPPAPTDIIP